MEDIRRMFKSQKMSKFVELYSKLFIDFYAINIYNFKKRHEMGGSYEQELYYY